MTLPATLSGEQIRTIGQSLDRDTLSVAASGSVRLPMEATLGVAYNPDDAWTLALEGRYEPWSTFESDFDFSDTEISDRWRVGGGAQYVRMGQGLYANETVIREHQDRGLAQDHDEDARRHTSPLKEFAPLPGRTLGIIGLGKIGSLVADAAIRLGMHVLGYDPEITVEAAWSLPSQVRKAHSIEEVLRGSEFVSLHVPLTPQTDGLMNRERLRKMIAPFAAGRLPTPG